MRSANDRCGASRRQFLGAAGALALGCVTAFALAQNKVRVINVVARKFEFVPGEIHVKQGETVRLQFTAPEVPMGFNLADLDLRTDIVPGKVSTLELTAGDAGTYTFLCDVFLSLIHI